MEHDQIKNGTHVRYEKNDRVFFGKVRSYNPGGPGIFVVDLQGQHHAVYLCVGEFTVVDDPEAIKKVKLKTAMNKILEAACENPLKTNGPYVLADRNAAKFMDAMHKALLELTADDQKGTI